MTITREQTQKIIDAADEVITALAGTNEDVHPDNSTKMVQLYDDLNDHYAPPKVVRELARIALAAQASRTVYQWRERYEEGNFWDDCTKEQYEGFAKRPDVETRILYTAPPAPVVPGVYIRDERGRMMLNGVCELKIGFGEGWNACRAAMQGKAEQPQSAQQNIPDERQAFEHWLASDYSPDRSGATSEADEKAFLAVLFHVWEARAAIGNTPVIPDGWVAVPVEPTEDMIVEGFESEPYEDFSEPEVWEAYDAMSGCQQAAHRAKLCWAAMINAVPKMENT